MKYLLDTHALLWLRANDPRMSKEKWHRRFTRKGSDVFVSIAALWEMSVKRSLGKLTFEGSISDFSRTMQTRLGFHLLPIDPTHLERLESLEFYHRDPFDRMMIAQSIEMNAVCITRDRAWSQYPVTVDW